MAHAVVALYGRRERPAVAALQEGVATAGLRPVLNRPHMNGVGDLLHDASAVVVDGLQGPSGMIAAAYQARGVPVFILDLPRLRMCDDGAGYHGLFRETLHDLPLRIGNDAHVLGEFPLYMETGYFLVCGQKPGDAAHGMSVGQCRQWARETIRFVREQYQVPVVFRPHPKDDAYGMDETLGADQLSAPATESIRAAMAGAAAVVTYNSNVAYDAIDAGIPVFYNAPERLTSFHHYAASLGAPVRKLGYGERRVALLRAAASQFTLDQLADGSAVRAVLLGEPYAGTASLIQHEEVIIHGHQEEGRQGHQEVKPVKAKRTPAAARS